LRSADDRAVITFEVRLGRTGHTPEPIQVHLCPLNHPSMARPGIWGLALPGEARAWCPDRNAACSGVCGVPCSVSIHR
jgi:hypothetical protein